MGGGGRLRISLVCIRIFEEAIYKNQIHLLKKECRSRLSLFLATALKNIEYSPVQFESIVLTSLAAAGAGGALSALRCRARICSKARKGALQMGQLLAW